MGANIVDVNMGCPVPKIAKHSAGCSLMREPEHAAEIINAMARAVKIPVTVKMRKGWDDGEVNAPELAKRVADAGAAAIAVHGRTARQSYSGSADWDLVAAVARAVSVPVFGSGDCVEPEQMVERMRQGVSGVFVGRGVLRNPWILAQARDLMEGRRAREISREERGQFLLDYMGLLRGEAEEAEGFRHTAVKGRTRVRPDADRREVRPDAAARLGSSGSPFPSSLPRLPAPGSRRASTLDRWVINKVRALCSWYTKGFDGGAQFRIGVNLTKSIAELEDLVSEFFFSPEAPRARPTEHVL